MKANKMNFYILYMDNKIYIQEHNEVSEFSTLIMGYEPEIHTRIINNISREDILKDSTYVIYNVNKYHELPNIDSLNRFFCEWCSMYYIWKNQIKSDLVTFCHYRRMISKDVVLECINQNKDKDVIFYYYMSIRTFHNLCNETKIYQILGSDNKLVKENLYLSVYLQALNLPPNLLTDILYYVQVSKKNYVDTNRLDCFANRISDPNYITKFLMRSIFTTYWEVFNELMSFIYGLFSFIFNKYNIQWNLDSVINWYINEIIPYYRENFDRNLLLYQSISNYDLIYNNENYGYPNSNVYRLFAYIIEILIGYYLVGNKNYNSHFGELKI